MDIIHGDVCIGLQNWVETKGPCPFDFGVNFIRLLLDLAVT